MSMNWKYISNSLEGEIDTIYCSYVDMKIPIVYYWTVLMKDGTEYDLNEPILNNILNNDIDIDAFNKAKDNYMNL
jgi:hypothetical protein